MEMVFRALADPSRRLLLDQLFQRDGQTLSELQPRLPMTRFGVMKHLKILEQADLVLTRRVGREKFHYLNPVPIQEIQNRWIDKFAQSWVSTLTGLKSTLEERSMTERALNERPRHVCEVYIRCTPQELWRAITDPELSAAYIGGGIISDFAVGSAWTMPSGEGDAAESYVEGEILEIEPPLKLVMTWNELEPAMLDDPLSRVTWEIEAVGESCKLTLAHDGFGSENETFRSVGGGWPKVLSSLKSLVETGTALALAD